MDRYISILKQLVNSREYDKIRSSFSLEERRLIYRYLLEDNNDADLLDIIDEEILLLMFTENEAKELIKDVDNEEEKACYIPFLSDSDKIKYLDDLGEADRRYIISTFQSDELKERYIDKITSEYSRVEIIKSLSDELKEKYIDGIEDESLRIKIIINMSDELKVRYIGGIEDEYSRVEIIKCLSDELKEKYIDGIEDESLRIKIIINMSDELKVRYIDGITSEYLRVEIIKSLSDELKVRYIDGITREYLRVEIIKSLSDELKVRYIDGITSEYSRVEIIKSLSDELKEKYIDGIEDEYSRVEIIKCLSDELKEKYIDGIEDESLRIKIIINMSDEYKLYFLKNGFIEGSLNIYYIIESMNNADNQLEALMYFDNSMDYESLYNYVLISEDTIVSNCLYDESKYLKITEYIANFYNYDIKKVEIILNNFGILGKNLFKIEDFNMIMKLDDSKFKKFIDIFSVSNTKLDNHTISFVLDGIIDREFSYEHTDTIQIFSNFQNFINSGDYDNILKMLVIVSSDYDYSREIVTYGSVDTFINLLIDKDERAIGVLRNIANEYIKIMKNKYKLGRIKQAYSNLVVDSYYEKNYIIKKVIATYSVSDLLTLIMVSNVMDKLDSNEFAFVNNRELLEEILKCRKNPKQYKETKYKKEELLSYFKYISVIFSKLYEDRKLKDLTESDDAKKEYYYKDYKLELIDILMELDYSKMINTLDSEEIYQELVRFINTYKPLAYGNIFSVLFKNIEFSFDKNTLVSLIDNYKYIKEIIESSNNSKASFLTYYSYANSFSSHENKILFGSEDAQLLYANPSPNAAPLKFKYRKDTAITYLRKMYNRQYISVPPISEDVSLPDGKKIKVILGNVTNPINLTYGERTGACMRIGGVANTLFDFCISNTNGFHIRLTDEEYNFVSRVSGFRNGNTVFLNQLRDSTDSRYDNDALIYAIEYVSKELIERSKDSSCPIENVIVSASYAFNYYNGNKVSLPTDNLYSGISSYIYNDIHHYSAILLATSNDPSSTVSLNFDNDNLPEYNVLRDYVKESRDSNQILDNIRHILMLDSILDGYDSKHSYVLSCDFNSDVPYEYGAFGEDWCLAVDENGNYYEYIMSNSKNKDLASSELNSFKEKLSLERSSSYAKR